MKDSRKYVTMTIHLMVVLSCLFIFPGCGGQSADGRLDLGRVDTGAVVSFVRDGSGQWGIEIAGQGVPELVQPEPVWIEVSGESGDSRRLEAGYVSVESDADGVVARAEVPTQADVVFEVEDRWQITEGVLRLARTLRVSGDSEGEGFLSGVFLATRPGVTWPDLDFLAPGLLYGDPTYDGDSSPGGMLNYRARHFSIREDFLSVPLFAVSFRDGNSVAVLDPSPQGDTTLEESLARPGTLMIDERFLFGALGAREADDGGVEFGFWLPGTTEDVTGRPPAPYVRSWKRRYNPLRDGFEQHYEVAFRFGQNETFRDVTRNTWRWAWRTLAPAVNYQDIQVVRQTLLDHLADRVMVVDDRAGIPYLLDSRTGEPQERADAMRATIGFCGKNLEAADQFLREAERDPGPRGQRMRTLGLSIIDSIIRKLPMSPPAGDGFNILTGEVEQAIWSQNQQFIRTPSEGMRVLMGTYRREKNLGREHPEWLAWCRDFADWLLTQQREDGSFPRSWVQGTQEVFNDSGTATYAPVPLFVVLTGETGDPKYLQSAIRAADYVWATYGTRGLYVGGAVDNPNITDKEAGMLSLEAFLALYEETKDSRWLDRAAAAADFTESWIWIWNVPMPPDADDGELHWKRDVPTVGLQGITARVAGHVDLYLDWSAPAYARLYRYTGDPHYLEVARILLHNTKAMLALPGRTYGMLGPGWQQENWRMGAASPGRGFGTPGKWLPWLSTNHLNSITGLEDFDPGLFEELSAVPPESP